MDKVFSITKKQKIALVLVLAISILAIIGGSVGVSSTNKAKNTFSCSFSRVPENLFISADESRNYTEINFSPNKSGTYYIYTMDATSPLTGKIGQSNFQKTDDCNICFSGNFSAGKSYLIQIKATSGKTDYFLYASTSNPYSYSNSYR